MSTSLLDVALECVARGWHVFPCWPKTKQPMTRHGWKDATNDENRIRQWWRQKPDANVAVACNPSNLCVVDIDHGLADESALLDWMKRADIPETYTVRTGRRPEFGVQLYFEGSVPDVGLWKHLGCEGQVKSTGGYVMAAGSVHPSGEPYLPLQDADVLPVVGTVRGFHTERNSAIQDDGSPITSNRNVALTSIAGKLRNAGLSKAALEVSLLQVNEDRCVPPMDEDEVKKIAEHAAAWEMPTPDPEVVLGKSKEPQPLKDWRERYVTFEQFRDVQPPAFLIQNFLEDGAVMAIGAPVAQRKSIVVANIIHSLLTGESLFGHFEVKKQPERVVYLCPEMGLVDIANRFKKLGLEKYVGERLFILSMDDPKIKLIDLNEELPGSVLILDTITRFVEGNQNDAQDMARFADICYAIKRTGATLILLHHSVKGAGDSKMSLDAALRGSTELAAFVTCVWSTQLEDIDSPHTTPSKLKCVKQRGFSSEPFQVICNPDYRMTYQGAAIEVKINRDAQAEEALAAIMAENPDMGINKLQAALKQKGFGRGGKFVTQARIRILGTGVKLTV